MNALVPLALKSINEIIENSLGRISYLLGLALLLRHTGTSKRKAGGHVGYSSLRERPALSMK